MPQASSPSNVQKLSLRAIVLMVFATSGTASAADLSARPPVAALPAWTWTGGYVGAHVGAAWGDIKFADPSGPSIFGDHVAPLGYLGGFQTGYNWQVPQSRLVLGVEADLSGIVSLGTATCLASSGQFVSSNCRTEPDASATITPRIGYAIDPQQRTLLYIKAVSPLFATGSTLPAMRSSGRGPMSATPAGNRGGRRAPVSSAR